MWQTVVLIPKGKNGNFMGIGLVEVLRKTMSSILNRRLMEVIRFHDVLQGFRAYHGTGTDSLDAKIIQQLTPMREEFLFNVFLDLQKSYDALYRDMCLGIIAAYGVGPIKIRLLRTYWGRLTMVARDGGYFGVPFKGYRGVN